MNGRNDINEAYGPFLNAWRREVWKNGLIGLFLGTSIGKMD